MKEPKWKQGLLTIPRSSWRWGWRGCGLGSWFCFRGRHFWGSGNFHFGSSFGMIRCWLCSRSWGFAFPQRIGRLTPLQLRNELHSIAQLGLQVLDVVWILHPLRQLFFHRSISAIYIYGMSICADLKLHVYILPPLNGLRVLNYT